MEYYCHESAQHTCHESTQYAQTTKWLREVASPVSMLPGYAKWLRGASRYTMYRTSAFAELFGVPHEAKIHHLRKKRCSHGKQGAAHFQAVMHQRNSNSSTKPLPDKNLQTQLGRAEILAEKRRARRLHLSCLPDPRAPRPTRERECHKPEMNNEK